MISTRSRLAVVVVVATVSVGGCGVPLEETATPTARADVPFGLLEDSAGGVAPIVDETTPGLIYLVRNSQLWAVTRELPAPVSTGGALGLLTKGPTSTESDDGLRSEISTGNFIGDVRAGGGLIQIDVSEALVELPPANQLLAVGQIVLTATQVDPESKVAFTVDSDPVGVPLPDGPTSSSPVGRDAYIPLVANP